MNRSRSLLRRLSVGLSPLALLGLALVAAPEAAAQRAPAAGRLVRSSSGPAVGVVGGSLRTHSVRSAGEHGGHGHSVRRVSSGRHGRSVHTPVVRRHSGVVRSVPHVHHAACGHVAGHHQVVREKVWVPGVRRRVHEPARFELRFDPCRGWVRVQVCAATSHWVQDPGRWEVRERRVWVPARYGCGY